MLPRSLRLLGRSLRSLRVTFSYGKDNAMRSLKYFLLGVLYGLFLKMIIDRIYANNDLRTIAKENRQLKTHIKLLQSSTRLEPTPLKQTTVRASEKSDSRSDDLKKIKGVGPAMEKKLNAAGVNTFTQFGRLSVKELQAIAGTSKRIAESAKEMIAEAKKLAKG